MRIPEGRVPALFQCGAFVGVGIYSTAVLTVKHGKPGAGGLRSGRTATTTRSGALTMRSTPRRRTTKQRESFSASMRG
jgi:hypothetical protein